MKNYWILSRKRRQKNTVFYFELIGEFPESLVSFKITDSGRSMVVTTGSTDMTNYLIKHSNNGKVPPVADGILKVCYQGDLKEVWSLQDVRPIQIGLDREKNSYVGYFCFVCSNMEQIVSKYF